MKYVQIAWKKVKWTKEKNAKIRKMQLLLKRVSGVKRGAKSIDKILKKVIKIPGSNLFLSSVRLCIYEA